jgi:hypothetical protein
MAGCAGAPLSNVGHMTERWIAALPDHAPTSTAAVPAPVGLQSSDGVKPAVWVNDVLGDPLSILPQEVIAAVWARSNRQDRYVQASRSEIAVALPGLGFPDLLPVNVAFVTSQLVFDPTTGRLSSDAVAAFGFWSVKPYSKSRSAAQLAVLMVANTEESPEPFVVDTMGVLGEPQAEPRCDGLAGSDVEECTAVTLSDGCPAWSLNLTNGWRLVWSERGYEYDLFVRNAGDGDLLARMAGSCRELARGLPAVSVVDAVEGTSAGADVAEQPGS